MSSNHTARDDEKILPSITEGPVARNNRFEEEVQELDVLEEEVSRTPGDGISTNETERGSKEAKMEVEKDDPEPRREYCDSNVRKSDSDNISNDDKRKSGHEVKQSACPAVGLVESKTKNLHQKGKNNEPSKQPFSPKAGKVEIIRHSTSVCTNWKTTKENEKLALLNRIYYARKRNANANLQCDDIEEEPSDEDVVDKPQTFTPLLEAQERRKKRSSEMTTKHKGNTQTGDSTSVGTTEKTRKHKEKVAVLKRIHRARKRNSNSQGDNIEVESSDEDVVDELQATVPPSESQEGDVLKRSAQTGAFAVTYINPISSNEQEESHNVRRTVPEVERLNPSGREEDPSDETDIVINSQTNDVENLLEATLVPDDVYNGVAVQPESKNFRRIMIGIVVLVVVSISSAIVVSLVLFFKSNDENPSAENIRRSEAFDVLRNEYSSNTVLPKMVNDLIGSRYITTSTSQEKAAEWLIFNDPLMLKHTEPWFFPRYALAVFYFAVTTPESSIPLWLSGWSACNWKGITCHKDTDDIAKLNLQKQKLGGSLPMEVKYLSNLEEFIVHTNDLVGTPPWNSFFELHSLSTLHLGDNSFTGTLPKGIGTMFSLTFLYLSMNQFTGTIPNEIFHAKNLESLELHSNNLTGTYPDSSCSMISNFMIECENISCQCCELKNCNSAIVYEWGLEQLGKVEVTLANPSDMWADGFPKDVSSLIGSEHEEYFIHESNTDININFDLLKDRLIQDVCLKTWFYTRIDQIDVAVHLDKGGDGEEPQSESVTIPDVTADGWKVFSTSPVSNDEGANIVRTIRIPKIPARYVQIRLRGGWSTYKEMDTWGLRRIEINKPGVVSG